MNFHRTSRTPSYDHRTTPPSSRSCRSTTSARHLRRPASAGQGRVARTPALKPSAERAGINAYLAPSTNNT